ncbi:MAG: SbcC/MukB-like Walker B domain-containing protein [Verrucomicrobiota bacterium]
MRPFPSKKDYLAHVRGFFEVGENAFSLLNRAAGLKQINSIDQIFRELVLDDRSAFERAAEVAREFDTLHGIYEELQTARRQRDALHPVRQSRSDWEKAITKLTARRRLKDLLPVWFAEAAMHLWQTEVEKLTQFKEETAARLHTAEELAARHEQRVQTLNEEYLRHGGAAILSIEELIRTKEQFAAQVRSNAGQYKTSAEKLGLVAETDETSFCNNRQRLPEIKAAAEAAHAKAREQAVNLAAELNRHRETERTLIAEIQQVEARPNSNIPADFQSFRELLAHELSMDGEDLPYVAEMVEVKGAERHWQGAIERAIGPERLRILVPAHRMDEALVWINHRENRLHVRLQSADPFPTEARFLTDGFTRKLDYRSHPLREHVKLLLSRRDRHCVDSIEHLRRTEHGMTVEGTMSDRDGRFEKQDQKPLSSGWMTGFDNRHLLATLQADRKQARDTLTLLEVENTKLARAELEGSQKIVLIQHLEALDFAQIDITGIERDLAQQRQRLVDLTRPDSDAANAKARYDEASVKLKTARKEITALNEENGACKSRLESAIRELNHARNRCRDGLSEEDAALAQKEFPLADITVAHQLTDAERNANHAIDTKIQRVEDEKSDIEKRLVRLMGTAKTADTGALSDAGTELRDLDAYLLRLKTLEDEALPEKLHRFLDYLNQSSGQGVTQLLTHIANEVTLIQERVTDLNATLSRVDFRQGQFLQLHAQAIGHPMLQQMETAQRKLRHIVLSQREDDGEAHYRALGEVVRLLREAAEKRHTLGSQALLDPRHRLQFSVVEVDRATGRSSGARKGSQTGSGGEKEMMASYILTASLSYALCPAGATVPRYATIVLDEAFSKSSPVAAARIIDALRAFGLHPLFVTPNKEISLLKSHTRSAVLVHNKNKRATLTSLTWEEIDAHARSRNAADPADPSQP